MNPGTEIRIPDAIIPLLDAWKTEMDHARGIILSGHTNPDGDSVSSIIALSEYLEATGKPFLAVGDEAFPATYSFLRNRRYYSSVDTISGDLSGYDLLVAVDSGDLERLGKLKDMLPAGIKIINVDHHKVNSRFGQINLVMDNAASIGEILYYFFQRTGFPLSLGMAEAIYISLVSDTGSFKYDSMHPEVHLIAAELLRIGVVPSEYVVPLYQNRSAGYLDLLQKALFRLQYHLDGRVAIAILTFEDLQESVPDDSEGIIETIGIVGPVSVYILIKEKQKNFFSASLRSKHQVDVAKIAESFGGGGHTRAAGCRTDQMGLDAFIEALVGQIARQTLPPFGLEK
jgi:phosphoesterase RecJ-like protein